MAIIKEQKIIHSWHKENSIDCVISDNRYGVYLRVKESIFISHQLNLLKNNNSISNGASALHAYYLLRNFTQFWVPDDMNSRYSGILSANPRLENKAKYIGISSRYSKNTTSTEDYYDAIFVLSGPEPSRTKFENAIIDRLQDLNKNIAFVRGTNIPMNHVLPKSIQVYNILFGEQLERIIGASALYIGRSGYSTIMDLISMEKPAVLIPTPGQIEQEYLAQHLKNSELFRFYSEIDFLNDINIII